MKIRKLLGLTVFGIAFAAPSAYAQLEEIVVTATKREESVQNVAISMQAVSGDQISQMRISKASDITKLAPNLNLSTQNTASQQINIRGVGTSDFFGNSAGSVGVYMDEVTMSASYLSSLGLYDLERVEILRGPQNSLFGRNTTGGAVNYISRLPDVGGDPEGFLDLALGNFGLVELEGGYTFRLSDSVALRLSGKSYNRDGVWNNLGNNGAEHGEKDRKSFRGTLAWEPNEQTSVTFSFHWADEDSDFDPIRAVGTRDTNGSPNFGIAGPFPTFGPIPAATPSVDFTRKHDSFNAQGNNPSTARWEDVYVTGTYVHQVENNGFYLKLTHEMDAMTFTSITSWDDSDILWTYETGGIGNNSGTGVSNCETCIYPFGGTNDGSPQVTLAIDQDQKFEQISQELRLTSTGTGPLKWIAGLYFFKEDSDLMQNVRFGLLGFDLSQPAPIGPFPGQPVGGFFGGLPLIGNPYSNQLAYQYAELENDVWSSYIHTDYALNDAFSLTFGLRYTEDEKTVPFNEVGNVSTLGDPITTIYDRELVLGRGAQNTLACDLDGDGNDTLSGVNDPGTSDNRGSLCTDRLNRNTLKFQELGGKLGLDWRPIDNAMVFGSYSRGFRSGKHDIEFLHGPHTGFAITDLDIETLDALELGVKSSLLDGRMQLNASTYFYTWKNQQTIFVSPTEGPTFVNIPESELKGLEVEMRWAPGGGWFVNAALGLQETEITKASSTGFDEVGHELPFAADTSFNLLVVKEIELGNGNILSLQADWQYRNAPKAYARDINFIDELEDTDRINFRVGYSFGDDDRYEVSAFGENITENETCAYKWDLTGISGTTYCVANEAAAFYGIQSRANF